MLRALRGTTLAVLVAFTIVAATGAARAQQDCTTTMVLVRHADRISLQDPNSLLSPAGLARAQQLIDVVDDLGVTAIYTSEIERTQQTAEPTAEALSLPINVISRDDPGALISDILQNHACETVLVVAHYETLGGIMDAFGVSARPMILFRYDQIFTLRQTPVGTDVEVGRYGAEA